MHRFAVAPKRTDWSEAFWNVQRRFALSRLASEESVVSTNLLQTAANATIALLFILTVAVALL
jgi:hypothetical protein